jgi:HAD superfamily hydrolase (TIGR01484 family)
VKRPQPADTIPEPYLQRLQLLASDIDDTLSTDGKVPPEMLDALLRVRASGVVVWLVTGRCAAWGQALSHYFDFDGVIAENGGVICHGEKVRVLADTDLIGPGRAKLAAAFAETVRSVPQAEVTGDNIGRLTDWTFDRALLTDEQVAHCRAIAGEYGLNCVASSIHVHFSAGEHSKATALATVCAEAGIDDRERVLTLGDSANDEPLFDSTQFPFSVGVANVADSLHLLTHRPRFILPEARSDGALWLARRILVSRGC